MRIDKESYPDLCVVDLYPTDVDPEIPLWFETNNKPTVVIRLMGDEELWASLKKEDVE